MTEPITFAMPSLGADMEEGRITEWLVRPGDRVERGQIVVVVETDKSDIEVEIFQPAVIAELLVGEGEVVPVGTPIARLTPDHTGVAAPPPAASPSVGAPSTAPVARPPTSSDVEHHDAARVASPVLRHLADELHVAAGTVAPTRCTG